MTKRRRAERNKLHIIPELQNGEVPTEDYCEDLSIDKVSRVARCAMLGGGIIAASYACRDCNVRKP